MILRGLAESGTTSIGVDLSGSTVVPRQRWFSVALEFLRIRFSIWVLDLFLEPSSSSSSSFLFNFNF